MQINIYKLDNLYTKFQNKNSRNNRMNSLFDFFTYFMSLKRVLSAKIVMKNVEKLKKSCHIKNVWNY